MPQLLVAGGISGGLAVALGPPGASFLVPFATTVALGFIGQVLSPSPSDLSATAPQDRQLMMRSTVAPRRWVLGRTQLAPVNMGYVELTGADDEFLHLVLPLCEGPIAGIDDIMFDDQRIGTLNGDGEILDGTFAREWFANPIFAYAVYGRVHKLLGSTTQVADAALVSESDGKWTADHRGRGVAALVLRLRRDAADKMYPNGIPQVRAVVRGVQAYDPRDGITRHTENPALLLRWYLTLAAPDGYGADAAEIDDDAIAAAANICEERVAVAAYTSPAVTVAEGTDTFTFAEAEREIGTGDGVTIASTGTLPSGVSAATTYYAIRLDGRRTKLATTYANAVAGTAIDITSAGSGTITLAHVDQARYTCNGVIDSTRTPRDILVSILSTMSGALTYTEGKFRLKAGAWSAPSASLGTADLAGPVQVQVRAPASDVFNGVRGTFTDPLADYQPIDFPPYKSATYKAQDGDIEKLRDFDLQYIDNPIRAQRMAKLVLQRARQGMTLTMPCKLTAFSVGLWDVVELTLPHFGFVAKTFRVVSWKLRYDAGWIVVLTLQEETEDVYGWTASEASAVATPVALALPDPRVVAVPIGITCASGTAQLLAAGDGSIISRILVTWTRAPDANARGYEVQYKRAADTEYTTISTAVDAPHAYLAPVEDAVTYDIRVRTIGALSVRSSWVATTHTVIGKTAAPTAPTDLDVVAALGGFDIAWPACPDLDYGRSELWEATSNDRATADRVFNGAGNRAARTGLAGAVERWYWVRNVDRSGNVSTWYPSSATAGVSGITLATAGGGVRRVTDASAITAGTGSPPPGGDDYWAVYDATTGKIWRWSLVLGTYTKAADGGDITAGSIAADKIAVANLAAINADIGAVTAGSIDIGGGKFSVASDGTTIIRNATTGARLEVRSNVIKVYDASGVLRVKLGDLSA